VTSTRLAFAFLDLIRLRLENQQKKTPHSKKQKQAIFFSLLRFQHFVDLFVILTRLAFAFLDKAPL